jgi:hypothetical protein
LEITIYNGDYDYDYDEVEVEVKCRLLLIRREVLRQEVG